MERGASCNYRKLGHHLAEAHGDLYRHPDGLVLVQPDGKLQLIDKGPKLAPVIVDRVNMQVLREGKLVSDLPNAMHLTTMLLSNAFLSQFSPLDEVALVPFYFDDFRLAPPGYSDRGPGQRVLYVGKAAEIGKSTKTIEKFLGIMEFETNADRTNAVAAALTCVLRRHWPGQKPVNVITSTKSHGGKGTITDFIRGPVPKADILYQARDWPMQHQLHTQLEDKPDIGMVVFDNVRRDSSGDRAGFIRSAFLESFVTNEEIILAAPKARSVLRVRNRFVVTINMNEGQLSKDLLNRALCIHLVPKGNVLDRECPLGNPKLEYLPKHQDEIQAELHGMVVRWIAAGRPLDESVRHAMSPWARVIGGILKVSGFTDFLGNNDTRKFAEDPLRKAIGILGAARPNKALRPMEWARVAVEHGLAKTLFPPNERDTEKGRERAVGCVLKRHLDETFTTETKSKILTMRLDGGNKRWNPGGNPHVRYVFQVEKAVDLPVDDDVTPAESATCEADGPTGIQPGNEKADGMTVS